MTFSIGGFFSFERSFLNLVVASSWRSGSSERTPFIMSSSSCRVDERMQVIIRNNADRTLPSPRRCFFIGVNGSCGDKVAPLGNVFLSLLPPDLDLLLLATFPEFILFKSLRLVLYDRTLVRNQHEEGREADARSLRLALVRSAMRWRGGNDGGNPTRIRVEETKRDDKKPGKRDHKQFIIISSHVVTLTSRFLFLLFKN